MIGGLMRHRMRNNSLELQIAAREMRREPTAAEAILWQALRGSRLGVRFRRQHPVGRFILDFWCAEAKLAVEVDGGIHDEQQAHDAERSAVLELYGYEIVRFRNDEVLKDLPSVIQRIKTTISARTALLPLSCSSGEGAGG
jgi:very-short-patch-repair endonuclease